MKFRTYFIFIFLYLLPQFVRIWNAWSCPYIKYILFLFSQDVFYLYFPFQKWKKKKRSETNGLSVMAYHQLLFAICPHAHSVLALLLAICSCVFFFSFECEQAHHHIHLYTSKADETTIFFFVPVVIFWFYRKFSVHVD